MKFIYNHIIVSYLLFTTACAKDLPPSHSTIKDTLVSYIPYYKKEPQTWIQQRLATVGDTHSNAPRSQGSLILIIVIPLFW